jgi:hypothetical protein
MFILYDIVKNKLVNSSLYDFKINDKRDVA